MPVISPVLLFLVAAIFAALKLMPRNRFSQIAQRQQTPVLRISKMICRVCHTSARKRR